MQRWFVILVLAGLCGSLSGCANDPYSQRRIQMREAHLQMTVQDLAKREERAPSQLDQKIEAINSWWRSDIKKFNDRMPTLGDYFW